MAVAAAIRLEMEAENKSSLFSAATDLTAYATKSAFRYLYLESAPNTAKYRLIMLPCPELI